MTKRLTPQAWIKLTRNLKEFEQSAAILDLVLKPHGFNDLRRELGSVIRSAQTARSLLRDRRRVWGKCRSDSVASEDLGCTEEGESKLAIRECTEKAGGGSPEPAALKTSE